MSKILGQKIYWDKVTNGIVVHRYEMIGDVRESTVDEDFEVFTALQERSRDSVLGIILEPGKYEEDFSSSDNFKIVESKTPVDGITTLIGNKYYDIQFSYPDPNNPNPVEPTYQAPLSEQLNELKQAIAELTLMIATP